MSNVHTAQNTHTHTQTYVHTHTHICMSIVHIAKHTQTYVHTHTNTHEIIQTQTRTYAHIGKMCKTMHTTCTSAHTHSCYECSITARFSSTFSFSTWQTVLREKPPPQKPTRVCSCLFPVLYSVISPVVVFGDIFPSLNSPDWLIGIIFCLPLPTGRQRVRQCIGLQHCVATNLATFLV